MSERNSDISAIRWAEWDLSSAERDIKDNDSQREENRFGVAIGTAFIIAGLLLHKYGNELGLGFGPEALKAVVFYIGSVDAGWSIISDLYRRAGSTKLPNNLERARERFCHESIRASYLGESAN